MIGKDASMERSRSNKYLKHTIFQENPYQRIQTGSSPLTLADPSLKNTLRLQIMENQLLLFLPVRVHR